MASAALASLVSSLKRIQRLGKQICCLQEKVRFLMEVAVDSCLVRTLDGWKLKRQIIGAAHQAEDIISVHLSKESRDHLGVEFEQQLQGIVEEFDSILKSTMELLDINYFCPMSLPNSTTEDLDRNSQLMDQLEQQEMLDSIEDSLGFDWNHESSMVGFHEDFLQIKDWLLGSPYHLEVMTIVGMTGTGKTTLARNLFENPAIHHIFKIHAWVSFSRTNNAHKMMKGILDSLRPIEDELDDKSIEQLTDILYRSLKGKRYFIVLDDVWDIQVWDDIKRSFPNDNIKSRIILTTRLLEMDLKDRFSKIHNMSLLTPKMSWTLFCIKVFGDEDCPQGLECAAKIMLGNCGGIPLAILVIGGLLSKVRRTKDDWQLIARTMKSSTTSEEQLKGIFSLIYMYLPDHLRACIRSMIILAEDYELSVPRIITLWIDEGLVNQLGSKSPEEVAEEFLKDLIDRSLMVVCKPNKKGDVDLCSVCSILKDFFMAKNPDILQILLSTSNRSTTPERGIEDLPRGYSEGVSMIVLEGQKGEINCKENLGISMDILFNNRYTKDCIRYCSLFPSAYEFTKDILVWQWIAQGGTIAGNSVFVEEACIQCFDILLKLKYVAPIGYEYDGLYKNKYKVGDEMNEFLQNHPVGSQVTKELDSSHVDVSELEHLSLSFKVIDQINFGIIKKLSHLHTLIIHGCRSSIVKFFLPSDLFLELKALRMLNISRTDVSHLPSSIENSKALRFLDMSETSIISLPEKMCNLTNLQTLKLDKCKSLSRLPNRTKELINLRHLILDVAGQLDSMPEGMGNLSELRTLRTFLVGEDDGHNINELKHMNKLSGSLRISNLENVKSPAKAADASLCCKHDLRKIEFWWVDLQYEKNPMEEEILACLEPTLGIQEIEVCYYSGGKFPSWISKPSFDELVSITLYMCIYCDNLPSLGQLPSLKFISVVGMNEVLEINNLFCGEQIDKNQPSFPMLEKLSFYGMPKLEKWTEIRIGDFPHLLDLSIESCQKFKCLPFLSHLNSLNCMQLCNCPELSCLPDGGFPSTLETLMVEDCPKLEGRCSKDKGEDWCKIAHVPAVYLDGVKIHTK
ncbi:putative disease resistance protein At3g14460 [Primulina tabacum]|uniref:putative disease resistance protein At3g14460 n=1 Tax=Primulina tabacum TaxID=48773 RepID=UPI003F5A1465